MAKPAQRRQSIVGVFTADTNARSAEGAQLIMVRGSRFPSSGQALFHLEVPVGIALRLPGFQCRADVAPVLEVDV